MILGHLPEILGLLLVALLVFGPKRIIEMGSSFGKMFREFRDATREMSWSNLLGDQGDAPRSPPAPTSQTSNQTSKSFGTAREETTATAAANATIVDGSIEPTKEP
jgi:sec-independent protein translocase protein TatA